MCQPPLSIGSFLARRPSSVLQSIACASTLTPILRRFCTVTITRGGLHRRIAGREHHDLLAVVAGLLHQLLARSRFWPLKASAPAIVSLGLPQYDVGAAI